jgi:hypothetical protein
MPRKSAQTLILLLRYCEEEAVRLRLSSVVVYCLRMARAEVARSTVVPKVVATIGSAHVH